MQYLNVTLRTIKFANKNYVEMFYYDDNQLVAFCFEEGHSIADYDYYLSTKPLNKVLSHDGIKEMEKRFSDYYNDENLTIVFKTRLYK